MAKFEEYLNSTSLTFSDLNDATKRKIERFEDVYEAYSNAYDAEDYTTSDKYEKQLSKLDSEITDAVKSQAKPVKVEHTKTETPKVAEVKEDVVETPKVEEVKEEPKAEEPKKEEPKKEEPKDEESKGSGFRIGMFEC
tara:strand:+ start:2298 stop:2711 length:414 start_codon:yes stop_codon:yes gene_type:complete